ncbi:MAG: wax ester/triacylglycerol synthase family O-acyltransferase [Acidimicrobiia bacterium]|nr:wax ester/triacylglycerol synthase family O-acyltransferase [Acidimicrobiia bacterium]
MKRLGGTDTLFLSMETPSWHQHIAGLTVLDPTGVEGFSYERAVEVLGQRLALAPKFTWKLKEVPLGLDRPVWVEDDDFRIERHCRRIGVPAPGGKRETAEMLNQIIGHQLDRRFPLWEYWYLEGLTDGRVAMVLKFHHALLDGVSGASLATVLLDMAPDGEMPEVPDDVETAGPEPSSWALLAKSARVDNMLAVNLTRYAGQWMRRGLALLEYQKDSDARLLPSDVPKLPWNAKIGPHRACAVASVSLTDVKRVKQHADVKVNDVVLALCAGAFRSYLDSHGGIPERPMYTSCPISTRAEGDTTLDNQISNMFVSLATDVDDPIERVQAIAESSRSAKGMNEAMQAKQIQSLGETAPPLVLNQAIRAIHATGAMNAMPTVVNTVISNVPGPPFPLYFAGARATGIYPGSLIVEAMGLNVTVISYIDRIDFGFAADPELVPDLWDMAEAIPEAMIELLEAGDLGDPTHVDDAWGE